MMKQRLLTLAALLLSLVALEAQTRIAVLSDTHVMGESLLKKDGPAWQESLMTDHRLTEYSREIFEQIVAELMADKPDLLLITGDLTKDGEMASHKYLTAQLAQIETAGVQVYVIPGNHDLGSETAFVYDGSDVTQAETATSEQFAQLYKDFGYGSDSQRETTTLTYACEPIRNLVLIGIDSGLDGTLSETTLNWVCNQAESARKAGKQVIAMMHHPLFPHISGLEKFFDQEMGFPYAVADYENVRNRLADSGIHMILTGHTHLQDIAKDYNADLTSVIYDVTTGAATTYPCTYRRMTLSGDLSEIHINTVQVQPLSNGIDVKKKSKERIESYMEVGVEYIFYMLGFIADQSDIDLISGLYFLAADGNEGLAEKEQLVKQVKQAEEDYGFLWKRMFGEYNVLINSMLEDKSNYGVKGREDVTDDLVLGINLNTGATNIRPIFGNKSTLDWHTLQGVRVTKPTRKGVYIHNGKAVGIKEESR
jgi:3',5'-cyclic AMP phosphodiesterase CpdA